MENPGLDILYLHTGCSNYVPLYWFNHERPHSGTKIPTNKYIKHSPITDLISPAALHEAPHLHRSLPCSSQPLPGKWLSSPFTCTATATCTCLETAQQSLLKALLSTFGMSCKTHSMGTRYGSKDTENIPDTKDSTPLVLIPQNHPMLEEDNDSSDEYCEDTDTHCPLVDLLEQFQQLKNQFSNLKSNTFQIKCSTLPWHCNQPHSLVRSQCTKPCSHTQTPSVQHRDNPISQQPCSKISPHVMDKTP